MDRFSIEELNLMCIYDTGTRAGLITGLEKIALELAPDDAELSELIQSAMKKLVAMSDQEYGVLILVPDYKEGEDQNRASTAERWCAGS